MCFRKKTRAWKSYFFELLFKESSSQQSCWSSSLPPPPKKKEKGKKKGKLMLKVKHFRFHDFDEINTHQ